MHRIRIATATTTAKLNTPSPKPFTATCPACQGEIRLAALDLVPWAFDVHRCPHCARAWRFPYAWTAFAQGVGAAVGGVLALGIAFALWELARAQGPAISGWWLVPLALPTAFAAMWVMQALNRRYLRAGRPLVQASTQAADE
jgi:hypothetical protein